MGRAASSRAHAEAVAHEPTSFASPGDHWAHAVRPRARDRLDARFVHYAAKPLAAFLPVACGIAAVTAILAAWVGRAGEPLTPVDGVGYWLGVAGSGVMLLLLTDPIRQRMRSSPAASTLPLWFRMHMLVSVIGPLMILFHTNFTLGAPSAIVALGAMLLVCISGAIGRCLYGKIHLGLYGAKAEVRDIIADAQALKRRLSDDMHLPGPLIHELGTFAELAVRQRRGMIAGLWWVPSLTVRARLCRARISAVARRHLAAEGTRRNWSRRTRRQQVATVADLLNLYFGAIRKAVTLALYNRLFSLWYALHLPLFALFVVAIAVHVVLAHNDWPAWR
jgi:hypothetical protein